MNSPLFTLVDVGARGGIHPRWRRFADALRVIAIDADDQTDTAPPVEWRIARYECIRAAAGSAPGSIDLYITREPGCSSTLRPNRALLDKFPESERFDVVKTTTVNVLPLDYIVRDHDVDRVDFIKLDTQGSELSILKGSTAALASAVGVEVEVEFLPLYEGQPLFGDVDSFLRSHGFELFDLNRAYWRYRAQPAAGRGQLVFADALYFRSADSIGTTPGAGLRLARMVLAAAAYGYVDYAHELLTRGERQALTQVERDQASSWLERAAPGGRVASLTRKMRGFGRLSQALARVADALRPDHWAYLDQRLGNSRK